MAEKLQVLDDFDGQFADDVSKLSKLKKRVVSEDEVAAAVACSDRVNGKLEDCCMCIIGHIKQIVTTYSGKPGNVREFDNCQGNVRDFTKKVREVSGKSCLKLFIVSCVFASIRVLSTSMGMI